MTMDMSVEPSRDSKSQSMPPKRSFDVAFLTGAKEKEKLLPQSSPQPPPPPPPQPPSPRQVRSPATGSAREHRLESCDGAPVASKAAARESPLGFLSEEKVLPSNHGGGKSAFKKVAKQSTNNGGAGGGAGGGAVVTSGASGGLTPCTYPFSFPAIATTLSLQLLQQNSKSLAMSLFNPPAMLAAHGHKSYGNLLGSNSASNRAAARGAAGDSSSLIEDYLRAQASLYQQQEKELNAGMFNLAKARLASEALNLPAPSAAGSASGGYPFAAGADQRAPRATAPSSGGIMASSPMMPPMSPLMMSPAIAAAAAGMGAPSQNVCAKCNLSFRMTSDLVYHMRSQHRREADPVRQKRQEKLRCPVCGENFRERHHLTRHMTSHDDREVEIK